MTSNQLTVEKETKIGKLKAKKGKESTTPDQLTVEKEKRIGKLKAKRVLCNGMMKLNILTFLILLCLEQVSLHYVCCFIWEDVLMVGLTGLIANINKIANFSITIKRSTRLLTTFNKQNTIALH
ncbi:hypothetical protein H5410_019857 [Solanum commersonii]|uniref:Uncharacterized protein n=1 Tax=Solanum commersonii TaxID=4109 RepID=A0A9J5Z9I5_SOLCO|nr:hypothetical protein H5410_019857 [Solanum commersonii]